MGRIISYSEKTGYNDGDYLLIDNGEGGTKRIRADRVGIQLDPTLTDPNKAAPANTVKPVDAVPTQGSTNAVSSGGVYSALDSNTERIESLEDDRYKPYPTDIVSGSIASFPDGADNIPMADVTVAIDPVQDLHGYDHPWPGGGGKNKLLLTVDGIKALNPNKAINPNTDGTWTRNSYTSLGITYTLVTDSDGNVIKIHVSGTKTGASYFDLAKINSIPYETYILNGGVSGINIRAYHFDGTHTATSSSAAGTQFTSTDGAGNNTFDIIVATDNEVNADVYPMVRLASETDPTFAPYENICPISGWTEVDVEQRGVNVFDKNDTVKGYIINANGKLHNNNFDNKATNYIPVVPNASYYIKSEQTKGAWGAWYDKDKNFISGITGYIATATDAEKTKTAPSNAYYMRLTVIYVVDGESYGNPDTFSVNYPSTDHDYHPYAGRSITINLGQTVYGGTLDVITGELVVDRAIVDLGTLTWKSEEELHTRGQFRVSQQKPTPLNPNYSLVQCSILKGVSPKGYTQFNNGEIGLSNTPTSPIIRARSEAFVGKTTEEIKAIMQGQQLCYELAEPIEIQLTPTQVNSLLGVNNIWADSGDSTVTYRADTTLYINRKIAEAVSALS